ncbi:MAG: hybrid sensor histidine kinase/response regulator [Candidatus Omnitrophica bacterium]|nr:hybrid sensor histidine kinase/response regulator [Candidatus Omnitrophota bacterium]MDE2009592.1 hybrid sensor histidine kinase/response regulator [Candidatus Omnitrophota bacterium]MDE2214480.1 hybrid sensor histidine kinase/response regulator [Candidatus Omnitrophota bacterium]MDE2231620.1 hybrid sensor histidine kinase/response regulator [Candidatus Omnitrophota bacterium]
MSKPIHVLFLDDEYLVLQFIGHQFANEPYGVSLTSDPDQAMETVRKENIKVVVSDQLMPKIQGVQFLQNVKQFNPEIVRILLTAHTDFSAAEEAINIGEVYRVISKPWKSTDLLSAVQHAIERYDLMEKSEQTNRKLKAMYEVQREFTSTVSHELRTPLASIKTAIDLVIKKTLGAINPEQEEVLGRAKKNVDRLKRLIDDILDLTKMESGKLKMSFMKNDIHQTIREVAEAQRDFAQSRGLYLKTALDGHVPYISFDSDRITQVLNNLVSNAIKFTKRGGITIKTTNKYQDDYVLVSVIDTGKGISEENLSKLFQKFHQIESPHENEEGGTGLGLAISKEIISLHGGRIWVESKLERGTTFQFVLPLQERKFEE